jgi:small subunit ribosomal protein S15
MAKSATPKKAAKAAVVVEEKAETLTQSPVKALQLHDKDTGSPYVQVGLLSQKIDRLADHLKLHKKDNHSRRGLLQMVGKRRRLIRYVEKTDGVDAASKLKKSVGLS